MNSEEAKPGVVMPSFQARAADRSRSGGDAMSTTHILDSMPLLEWATTKRHAVYECAPALARYVALETALKPGETPDADLRTLEKLGVLSTSPGRDWFVVRDACRNLGVFYVLSVFHAHSLPYRVFTSFADIDVITIDGIASNEHTRTRYVSQTIRLHEFLEHVAAAQDAGLTSLLANAEPSVYALFDKVHAPSLCALFADLPRAAVCSRWLDAASGCAAYFEILYPVGARSEDDLFMRMSLSREPQAPKLVARALLSLHEQRAAERPKAEGRG